jgi:TPR repeat protein
MASHDVASNIYQALGRGVTRSKRRAMQCLRQAAENGYDKACLQVGEHMYMDQPYTRDVGHVGESAGAASLAGVMEGHDVPSDVMTGVLHWLRKGGTHNPVERLDVWRRVALEGAAYCRNEGCQVVGLLKDFKVCPQCKTARYCGAMCQKQHWTEGGHKETCCTCTGTSAHTIK